MMPVRNSGLKQKKGTIRAVVVDDSATFRELLTAILQNEGDIVVVGTASNGEDAVVQVRRLNPDVVTMDLVMPRMDGLEATRRIMRECPTPIVVISGGLKQHEMDLTFQALEAGALSALHKPGLLDADTATEIIRNVRLMAGVPVIHHWGRQARPIQSNVRLTPEPAKRNTETRPVPRKEEVAVIGIAASTGGPSAIARLLNRLPADYPLPILLVQHISPGFAGGLADWLGTQTSLRVEAAAHGDSVRPGLALLAPDDYHMQVNAREVVELVKAPAYKGLRPSANYLFASLGQAYGPRAMGIILTGMGDDGADGMEVLHNAGGLTIAQDADSCVVFGMPREAMERNAIDRTFSIDEIAALLEQLARSPYPII